MSTCATCGLLILEPNQGYGISPQAVCHCCVHDRKPVTDIEKLVRRQVLLQKIESYAANDLDKKIVQIFNEEIGGLNFSEPPDMILRIGRRIAIEALKK